MRLEASPILRNVVTIQLAESNRLQPTVYEGRLNGEAFRAAAIVEAHGVGGSLRSEERSRLLRLHERRQEPHADEPDLVHRRKNSRNGQQIAVFVSRQRNIEVLGYSQKGEA